jgi:site-specific DNA-cytosine methylase
MRVLAACEVSGRVREAFRARGHDAYSCDLLPARGGAIDQAHHYRRDVFEIIGRDWDLVIAFPPCTYLSCAGAQYWGDPVRKGRQLAALGFVWALMNAPARRVVIENPSGAISKAIRPPDQTVQPWQFGDPWRKRTCLWLRGVPPLVPDQIVDPGGYWVDGGTTRMRAGRASLRVSRDRDQRAMTFPGIARAMAEQWG